MDKTANETPRSRWFNPLGATSGAVSRLATYAEWGRSAYGHLFVDHEVPLGPAIGAERRSLETKLAGTMSYYASDHAKGRPLVLFHSINAAASAYEVMPIFERYRTERPVFAVDLPGFGFSERRDREYTPAFYAEAIDQVLRDISQSRGPCDVVALSLSCEFAALATQKSPDLVRSLTFVSPTGFQGPDSLGPLEEARRLGLSRLAHAVLGMPLVGSAIYDLLATEWSIHHFLEKSFVGSVDDGLARYDYATAHQPGALHAPLAFLSGGLFTPDIRTSAYAHLTQPVLVLYDQDGYVSFDRLPAFAAEHPNWRAVRIEGTKGLPHFERPGETGEAMDAFFGRTKEATVTGEA